MNRLLRVQDLNIPSRQTRREEIRGVLVKMKFCSDCIFQGGDIKAAWEHLSELNGEEEKRFLFCHALAAGDHIDKSAARALLLDMNPAWKSLEDVLPSLSAIEREEIIATKSVMDKYYQPQTIEVLEEKDEKRISRELSQAPAIMGLLPYQEKVWILIPENEGDAPLWIEEPSHKSEKEKLGLLSIIRSPTRWALYVGNPSKGRRLEANASERSASIVRKQERPDLEHKMKFFIVSSKEALEYSMVFNRTRIWPIGISN